MKLDLNSQTLNVSFACRIEDAWVPVPETACTQSGFDWTLNGAHYSAQFTPAGDTLCYTLQMDAPNPTQLRMWLAVPGQSDYFHVIPCNIYGDNHAAEAKPGEFPLLTKDHHEVAFCAPLWEFRADRAAMPLAALCWDGGVAAAAVEPYSESEAGIIRNGVFAALPDAFGISLGYTNDPTTFKNRSTPAPSTRSMACKAQTSGRIYLHSGPRTELHEIIRQEYARHQDRAVPRNTLRQAVQGMLDTFAYQNFDAAAGEYTNRCCRPPRETEMRPWRLVTEIGWTGGGVANVVPNIEETHTEANWLMKNCPYGASGWGDAATVIPWVLYQMYGDDTILRSQYPSMKRWVDFMRANTQNGLFDFKMQLGDWVALDAEPGSYFGATPTALTSQAYYALSAQLLALAAEVLGNRQDAELYAGVHRQAAQDFAANFFTLDGAMTAQTQTAHILALRFGLTPQKWKQKTIQRLLELLEQQNGHLVTGFLGTPYFCAALSQNGCWQQAYDLMLKKDYPGWLYQVLQGATTVWEHWDGRRPDGTMWSAGMNSFNHYAYGAVGAWLYGECAGIGQQPGTAGFCAARLAPRPGGGLRWAQAWHQTPFGRYALQWQVDDEKITVTAAIPPNAAAKICLEPGAKLLETDGLTFAEQNGCPTAQVGSGQYQVSYTMEQ